MTTDFDREALKIAEPHQWYGRKTSGAQQHCEGWTINRKEDLLAFAHAIRDLCVPVGSVVVPREPTEAMLKAAFEVTRSEWSDPIAHFVSHYKAMIAAAEGEKK